MWDALFVVAGLIEVVPVFFNFIKPSLLFPGVNEAGVLAAQWWNAAAGVLGLLSFLVVGDDDGDKSKTIVALALIYYNLSIGVMTILRLCDGLQVDGPEVSPSGSCCNNLVPSTHTNLTRGLLGIAIHFGIASACLTFLAKACVMGRTWILLWGPLASAIVLLLSFVSVFCLATTTTYSRNNNS